MEGNPNGGYVGAAFKKAIFDCDTTRPVTANSEDTVGDTLTKVMDVNSFSYNCESPEVEDFVVIQCCSLHHYPTRLLAHGRESQIKNTTPST